MRMTLLAVLAVFAATEGAQAQTKTHPTWAVGKFEEVQETPCGNYSSSYDAAGRYEGGDSTAGTWYYRDHRICFRQLLDYDYDHDRWRDAPRKLECTRVRFKGGAIEYLSDKGWFTSRRCAKPDISASTAKAIDAAERRRVRRGRR